jgi:putative effector of murein hydrolase LrgA (UPF0299 family)
MDFEKTSFDLNNKNIIAYINEKSNSFIKYGPQFIGRLVGRTIERHIPKTVVSLIILTHEYVTYNIPCEDIRTIAEVIL